MATLSTFISGAFAGLLVGGFVGSLIMALIQSNRECDETPETGTDTYCPIRERYEAECG